MASYKKTGSKTSKAEGDVIAVDNRGDHNAIAAGRDAKAIISHGSPTPEMDNWRKDMDKQIDARKVLLPEDKADLKDTVAKVADEVSKGKQANAGRLERLLNTISSMAPDIFEVAVASLANPLAGIGLVATKIGDRAKVGAK